jgi:hypothetical protein
VLASPGSLLTGFDNLYTVLATILALAWCLYFRRNILPDMFVGFYCFMLLFVMSPPQPFVAPVLPLILWMIWRVVSRVRIQEALAAGILIVVGAGLRVDIVRIPNALSDGAFSFEPGVPDKWSELQKLFGRIRTVTPPASILLSASDALVYLNTGNKTVRGFVPSHFGLFYAPRRAGVTPDQLSTAILRQQIDYVVVTPENGFAESPSFHAAVQVLERGGVLEPVAIPAVSAGYRLLRVH